jgi:hypothetical protein
VDEYDPAGEISCLREMPGKGRLKLKDGLAKSASGRHSPNSTAKRSNPPDYDGATYENAIPSGWVQRSHYYNTTASEEPVILSRYQGNLMSSRGDLYNAESHQPNLAYPRMDYGFQQASEQQFMDMAPHYEASPSQIKWCPIPQHQYTPPHGMIAPGHYHCSQPQEHPPPLSVPTLPLPLQLSEVGSSAATSFTTDYDSDPRFRTGSLSHPNPRAGVEVEYAMPGAMC